MRLSDEMNCAYVMHWDNGLVITNECFLAWIKKVEAMEAKLSESMPEELRRVTGQTRERAMMMCKQNPISEAVKAALESGVLAKFEIRTFQQANKLPAGHCYGLVLTAEGSTRDGAAPKFRIENDEDLWQWQQGHREDAASALRAIADQLAPDMQTKALETVAILSEKSIFLPRRYREKLLWIIAFVTSPEKYKATGVVEKIDELLGLPPIQRLKLPPEVIDALEEAHDFFVGRVKTKEG